MRCRSPWPSWKSAASFVTRPPQSIKGDRMTAIYLKEEFGGFAIHLLQK